MGPHLSGAGILSQQLCKCSRHLNPVKSQLSPTHTTRNHKLASSCLKADLKHTRQQTGLKFNSVIIRKRVLKYMLILSLFDFNFFNLNFSKMKL